MKFGSMEKIKITSSEPKEYLVISREGLITSLDHKTIARSKKNKNSRHAINNISMKDISTIIKDFLNFPYKWYVRKRPKHEPTDS